MNSESTLRVILDEVGEPTRTAVGRYAEELTRALITTAPEGIGVAGFVAGADPERRERIETALPDLSDLRITRVPARELRQAWLHTVTTMPFGGLVHSPSLLAPLRPRELEVAGEQVVVTVHGLDALSDRSKRKAAWFQKALRRAHKHAHGVVVPTHAIAAALAEHHDFGDRVRVIGAGVPASLRVPLDADERADRLGLPERFVMAMTTASSLASARRLVDAVASSSMPDVGVVLVGPVGWGDVTVAELAVRAGLPASRILMLGELQDHDLAVVYERAEALLVTNPNDGFGLQLLEAFSFGTPVVHAATASLVEIADGASVAVELPAGEEADAYASALASLLDDADRQERLALLGRDRSRAFDWRSTAAQVWQLHADL